MRPIEGNLSAPGASFCQFLTRNDDAHVHGTDDAPCVVHLENDPSALHGTCRSLDPHMQMSSLRRSRPFKAAFKGRASPRERKRERERRTGVRVRAYYALPLFQVSPAVLKLFETSRIIVRSGF